MAPRARILALPLAALAAFSTQAVAAQPTPRLPDVRSPSIPGVPPRNNAAASNPSAMIQDFIQDTMALSNPIDTTTVTDADNARIDREVAAYRALADRVAGGRYDSMPDAQRQPMLQGLRNIYDAAVMATDDEIAMAQSMITGRGGADAAYNFLLAFDTYLYAAEQIFPAIQSYPMARSRVAQALQDIGGSRAGANAAEEQAELAAARNVRMPAAIASDATSVAQFRQAWQTSGIDLEIIAIHITSSWRDKVENGRVVGQRRDAAIAARDPNNPDRCNLYDFTLFRDFSGSVRRDSHNTTRIACENVPT